MVEMWSELARELFLETQAPSKAEIAVHSTCTAVIEAAGQLVNIQNAGDLGDFVNQVEGAKEKFLGTESLDGIHRSNSNMKRFSNSSEVKIGFMMATQDPTSSL